MRSSNSGMASPRVLLIPDKFHWILGTIAKEIVSYNPDLAFAYATRNQVRQAPASVIALTRSVDIVHWIIDLEFFQSLPHELDQFPRTVASVHHVLNWDLAQKCRGAALIHTVSQEWKEYLVEKGIEPSRIHVIPNGVDVRIFNPDLPRSLARRRFSIPESAYVVGFFGSAHPPSRCRKGVDTFIQAMLALQAYVPELGLFISGQNWDEDVQMMRQYGLRVVHPGFLPASMIPSAYRTLDAFVVASTIEGGPVTAFEAMACGVPLVSTSVGMVRDAVVPGRHALIIPANQPEALAQAIQRLYGSPVIATHLRDNGSALVRDHFQWAQIAPQYGDLYRLLLEQGAGRSLQALHDSDPFVRQRQRVLREDLVELMLSLWQRGQGHVALMLCFSDVIGLQERVSVLGAFWGALATVRLYQLYERLPAFVRRPLSTCLKAARKGLASNANAIVFDTSTVHWQPPKR